MLRNQALILWQAGTENSVISQWENGGHKLSELEMKMKSIPMCVVWNNTHQFNSNRKIRWSPGCLELSQTIHPSIRASDLLSFLTHRCSFMKHQGSVTEQSYSLCNFCFQISHCGRHHELTPSKASLMIQGEKVSGPAQLLPGNGLQQQMIHTWG